LTFLFVILSSCIPTLRDPPSSSKILHPDFPSPDLPIFPRVHVFRLLPFPDNSIRGFPLSFCAKTLFFFPCLISVCERFSPHRFLFFAVPHPIRLVSQSLILPPSIPQKSPVSFLTCTLTSFSPLVAFSQPLQHLSSRSSTRYFSPITETPFPMGLLISLQCLPFYCFLSLYLPFF